MIVLWSFHSLYLLGNNQPEKPVWWLFEEFTSHDSRVISRSSSLSLFELVLWATSKNNNNFRPEKKSKVHRWSREAKASKARRSPFRHSIQEQMAIWSGLVWSKSASRMVFKVFVAKSLFFSSFLFISCSYDMFILRVRTPSSRLQHCTLLVLHTINDHTYSLRCIMERLNARLQGCVCRTLTREWIVMRNICPHHDWNVRWRAS